MSWVGGKKALRDDVLARFPPYYERYIEVFGGAGWVLFRKPPGMDFEVYNDFNGNLANLYRCVRDKPNKLKYKLRYVLDSREDFDWIASLHKRGLFSRFRDVDRAAKFYQLIRYSYASGLDSFGSQPHSIWSDFPMIDLAARRLQKVVVENKDFEKLIRQYDRPVSFFIAIRRTLQLKTTTKTLVLLQKTISDCVTLCLTSKADFWFRITIALRSVRYGINQTFTLKR